VGLGKTTVAALVAWVVASAGQKRGVRILAPNDVMMRRWVEELRSHVEPLMKCAPALHAWHNRVKEGRVGKLRAGSIQVVKHSYAASDSQLACDLLIVDEAHRAKGEDTAFSKALRRQKKSACRVLILTATPFSIHLAELNRMLTLIGAENAHRSVRDFSRALNNLYSGNTARDAQSVAKCVVTNAQAAIEALAPFVIRHGIDALPLERKCFGTGADWNINVPPAKPDELELMMRLDRALRVTTDHDSESSRITNDPRFHVGWQHFDATRKNLKSRVTQLPEPAKAVVECHLKSIKKLLGEVEIHSKMAAVALEVKSTIEQGEKVVLFCHHIATAQELTAQLDLVLPKLTAPPMSMSVWKNAWKEVLGQINHQHRDERLSDAFVEWLCADLIRAQTWNWLPAGAEADLVHALRKTRGRHPRGPETIAEAARRLYHSLLQSRSSRAVLKAAEDRPVLLPGANGASRVLGVCPSENEREESLFLHNQQPDTVISIFNSPFGPDVLVVTDRLSEGIDLHRYCRHLIHYELDPSPIRTVQRNGRLRRVNSWAAASGQPIRYAYPAFRGTRDHRLVQIMKKRIDSFSLLLGGVQDFDVDEVVGTEEEWRNQVIRAAKARLEGAGRQLGARHLGTR
jgi:ERCC4-related helicase